MEPVTTEVVPSARRLVGSLRDLGYDLVTALSDVIDNSIAAGASNVQVDTEFDGDCSWIRITDNGVGMSPAELREAMRFGTRRTYVADELGKFGLGLKAASLSQCRRLTVATRTTEGGRIHVARWDLDHVERSDRWEVLWPSPRTCPLASESLRSGTGTVVLWERLDRMTRYRLPEGRVAERQFQRLTEEIRANLSMTFHRFLDGESKNRRRLGIHVNGERLHGWDPFARKEGATQALPVQHLRLKRERGRSTVRVSPFVLPPEARFASAADHRRAGGPDLWSRQQGFYFYRSDRLIQAGGWNRLRTQDEHTKLARIAIDIPPAADEMFELNVSKTQVRVPLSLRADLAAVASAVCRAAEETYRRQHDSRSVTPRVAPQEPAAALRELVRLILGAAEELVRAELSGCEELTDRLVARLHEMEWQVIGDLQRRSGQ